KKFGLMGLATIESQYLEGRTALNCSDATAADVDSEVVALLKESYEKALSMLRENRDLMDKIAAYLIEKETITGKEFMEIFRREKGLPEPEEKPAEKKVPEPAKEAPAQAKADEVAKVAPAQAVVAAGESIFDRKSIFDEPAKADGASGASAEDGKNLGTGAAGNVSSQEAKAEQKPAQQDAGAQGSAPADDRPVGRFSQKRLDD
ncbi:MAG: hypothetical protein J6W66_04050, partial [Lachnospiraceae bacterium]|nr:hypothetical protein [Lachnospiraceae bacterium]